MADDKVECSACDGTGVPPTRRPYIFKACQTCGGGGWLFRQQRGWIATGAPWTGRKNVRRYGGVETVSAPFIVHTPDASGRVDASGGAAR